MMRISLLAMDGFRMDGLTFSSCFYLHSQAKKSGEDEKLYDRKREKEKATWRKNNNTEGNYTMDGGGGKNMMR
jgi:hypothetical protein